MRYTASIKKRGKHIVSYRGGNKYTLDIKDNFNVRQKLIMLSRRMETYLRRRSRKRHFNKVTSWDDRKHIPRGQLPSTPSVSQRVNFLLSFAVRQTMHTTLCHAHTHKPVLGWVFEPKCVKFCSKSRGKTGISAAERITHTTRGIFSRPAVSAPPSGAGTFHPRILTSASRHDRKPGKRNHHSNSNVYFSARYTQVSLSRTAGGNISRHIG